MGSVVESIEWRKESAANWITILWDDWAAQSHRTRKSEADLIRRT